MVHADPTQPGKGHVADELELGANSVASAGLYRILQVCVCASVRARACVCECVYVYVCMCVYVCTLANVSPVGCAGVCFRSTPAARRAGIASAPSHTSPSALRSSGAPSAIVVVIVVVVAVAVAVAVVVVIVIVPCT